MNNYKLLIEYDGGRYKGWQRLSKGEATIQDKIEHVLSEFTGEAIELIGSSRTDAGVHALSQVSNFKTRQFLHPEEMKRYVNHYLPNDICVTEVTAVPEAFHARYHAKGKTYLYKIWNEEAQNPFLRKYSMHEKKPLQLDAMKQAAAHFVGRHDFTAFSNAKANKKSMVREITAISIEAQGGLLEIRVSGNGFLYNMVRKMIGCLVTVGLGDMDASSIPDILAAKERSRTGTMAEACGLYLEEVTYEALPKAFKSNR